MGAPTDKKQKPESEKIVYEDIWDDVPPLQPPASTVPTVDDAARARFTAGASCTRSTDISAGDKSVAESLTSGVFLPWASGENTVGMDALTPAAGVVEKRKDGLHALLVEQQKVSPGTAEKEVNAAAWYSKYTEKVQTQQEGTNTSEGAPAVSLKHSLDFTETCNQTSIGFSAAPTEIPAEPAKMPVS